MTNNHWLARLKIHYTAPMRISFRQFKLGAMLFFTGMVSIYIAQSSIEPSLQQELLTLTGIIGVAVGFLIAMLAQVRMLISRLMHFFLN